MNRSGILFVIIAIAILLGSVWFNSQWLGIKYFQLTKKEKRIDYYLSNFTLLNVQEDGTMRYFVTGKHLIHQQASGSSEIFKPVLEARNSDNTVTSLIAKKALQKTKNGEIELSGKVIVNKKNSDKGFDGYNIETSNLIYDPVKRELHSDATLVLKSAYGSLQGTGFSSKLGEQEFRINANVQAIYHPHKQPSK